MTSDRLKKIFITGGTGYIGRYLIAELLKREHQVRALVRPGRESKLPPGSTPITGNALEKDSYTRHIAPADTFVHLIGVPHPSPTKSDLFRKVDLASIQVAVPAAKAAGIKHFIYLSVAQPLPFMKNYVEVRKEGEKIIQQSNLHATVLRPFYILGPGHRWPYFAMPVFALMRNTYQGGKYRRSLSFVTIGEMVQALVTAIEQPVQGIRIWDALIIKNPPAGKDCPKTQNDG